MKVLSHLYKQSLLHTTFTIHIWPKFSPNNARELRRSSLTYPVICRKEVIFEKGIRKIKDFGRISPFFNYHSYHYSHRFKNQSTLIVFPLITNPITITLTPSILLVSKYTCNQNSHPYFKVIACGKHGLVSFKCKTPMFAPLEPSLFYHT